MKSLALFLTTTCALFLGWRLLMATEGPAKKFGPEWTKDVDGKSYKRNQVIVVSHPTNLQLPYTWYTLPSESHTVTIEERDEKGDIKIDFVKGKEKSKYMRLEARMDDEGKVREFMVNFKTNYYFDLDGDGMIDCFYDSRGKNDIPMVIFEGCHIQVEDRISLFGHEAEGQTPTAWGIGRKVEYRFVGSAWVAVPQ